MKKIELIVGHKSTKKGAGHWSGMNEWDFNCKFVEDICIALSTQLDTSYSINQRFRNTTYKEMTDSVNANLAIEFHLNAGGGTGTEMLVAKDIYDRKTEEQVAKLSHKIAKELDARNRGIKLREEGSRGYYFLRNADAELAIIAETCFISSTSDIAKLFTNYDAVVNAYVDWIKEWV